MQKEDLIWIAPSETEVSTIKRQIPQKFLRNLVEGDDLENLLKMQIPELSTTSHSKETRVTLLFK